MPPTWLPLLLALGGLAALASRSISMRRAGVNPWVLPTGDDAYGFLGRALVGLIATYVFIVVAWAVDSDWSLRALGSVPALLSPVAGWTGIALASVGLALLVQAQRTMGASWRVGIPQHDTPHLVTDGPFRVSRNPVFFGMILAALGFALVAPHAVSWAALAATFLALSVQIRLEEAFLQEQLGDGYTAYRNTVGRWFGRRVLHP